MHKTVEQIISGARIKMSSPSERQMPVDDLRFLLHNVLEEYHRKALKTNQDYYTDDEPVTLVYDADRRGFTITLDTSGSLEFYGRYFYFQPLTADPDKDSWTKVPIIKEGQYEDIGSRRNPAAFIFSNNWKETGNLLVRLNLKEEFVSRQRWRLIYRLYAMSGDALEMSSRVPFPQEFNALLEDELAIRGLPLVKSRSQGQKEFLSLQMPLLLKAIEEGKEDYMEWLEQDFQNVVVTPIPFHYITNNPQTGSSKKQYKVEPLT